MISGGTIGRVLAALRPRSPTIFRWSIVSGNPLVRPYFPHAPVERRSTAMIAANLRAPWIRWLSKRVKNGVSIVKLKKKKIAPRFEEIAPKNWEILLRRWGKKDFFRNKRHAKGKFRFSGYTILDVPIPPIRLHNCSARLSKHANFKSWPILRPQYIFSPP